MFVSLLKYFLGKPAGERIDVSDTDAKALVAQQIAVPISDGPLSPFQGDFRASGVGPPLTAGRWTEVLIFPQPRSRGFSVRVHAGKPREQTVPFSRQAGESG
jgi:hypothetical protein